MSDNASKLTSFLRDYTRLLLNLLKEWRKMLEKYPEEIRLLYEPARISDIINELSDEEVGKIFRIVIELGSIAPKLSKIAELDVSEIKKIEKKLEDILAKFSREDTYN